MAAADAKTTTGFNGPAVVLCGLAALVFIVALSLFLQGGYLAAQKRETQAKTVTPVNEVLRAAQAEHLARLQEAPRWLDEQRTKAIMPVDAAMDRLAAKSVAVQVLPAAPAVETQTAPATDHAAGH
jgi:hypothetical protein